MLRVTGAVVTTRTADALDELVSAHAYHKCMVYALPVAIVIVLVAGALLNLALPFAGDQSLFAVGARELTGGAILYKDFWDLKQPGIYWFFATARGFGDGPVAVHLLEGLWDLALGITSAWVACRQLHARMWFLAPLFAVTYVQLLRMPNDATQVEGLAGLALLAALALFVAGLGAPRRATLLFFAAGLAAGTALLFKLLFLVVVVAMWTTAFAVTRTERSFSASDVARAAVALLVGVGLPLVATFEYFAVHGALAVTLATWFVEPRAIVSELPHQSVHVLSDGLVAYTRGAAPIVVLALVGAIVAVRERSLLGTGTLAWVVGAIATILLQVTSWWTYQWQLLTVPLALLATVGVSWLIAAAPRRAGATAVVLAIICVAYPLARAHRKLGVLAHAGFGRTAAQRDAIGRTLEPAYARARETAPSFSRSGKRDLYVFGNAELYEVLAAFQPVAINGWSPELLDASLRTQLLEELRRERPLTIYVDDAYRPDFDRFRMRSPAFVAFLRANYLPSSAVHGGRYERR